MNRRTFLALGATAPVKSVAGLDHAALVGLVDDDHKVYIMASGTRPFMGPLNDVPGAALRSAGPLTWAMISPSEGERVLREAGESLAAQLWGTP